MPLPAGNNENGTIDYGFRFRYETLRSLMHNNVNALKIIKDLEADLNHMRSFDYGVKNPVQRLINRSFLMAQELNLLTRGEHTDLYAVLVRIKKETDRLITRQPETGSRPIAVSIDSESPLDEGAVGGKASGVALLKKYFSDAVPSGFVITAAGYDLLLEENNLADRIRLLLSDIMANQDQLKTRTATIRRWIKNAQIPDQIDAAIAEYAERADQNGSGKWAVRASPVYQDGSRSFAGLFKSRRAVLKEQLPEAYLDVVASRFSDNAVMYRLNCGLREIKTPMAVLFSPMVDAGAVGTVQIQNEKFVDRGVMVINAVSGEDLPDFRDAADVLEFHLSPDESPTLLTEPYLSGEDLSKHLSEDISEETLLEIGKMAWAAKEKLGYNAVLDWAVDKNGQVHLLQTRRHDATLFPETTGLKRQDAGLLVAGGVTIFPGRAEGNPVFLKSFENLELIKKGDIVIVEKTDPRLATLLPFIGALLVLEGVPSEPLATLARESFVPSLFNLGKAGRRLLGKNYISVNATKRKIYEGSRWPGMRERVLARISGRDPGNTPDPLYNHILSLNFTDPDGSAFKGKLCTSVHDAIWFMYEMSVRSMFGFGDQHKRGWKSRSCKLKTALPLKFQIIDLDDSVISKKKAALPEEINCTPFEALWEGISDKNLHWPERWEKAMLGMPSDFKETVLGGGKGPRRPSDMNYAIAAKDYINLNARLSYHYLMVDSIVGPGTENNHIHFRFRGGGGSDANRARCVSFLETVLRRSGFGVDRKGDIVNAWLMCYPQPDCENALKLIGRLVVCARELDAVLGIDRDVEIFAKHFLAGNYDIFA